MIRLWGVPVPERRDLPALPRGIVLHWSGGSAVCNSTDLKAYHYGFDHDGKVRPGVYSVGANMRRVSGRDYAMHTGGRNSYTVGLSVCGMQGYVSPKNPGRNMITEVQVRTMCEMAGYFAWLGGLDPENPEHIGTHQEQWTLLGIKGERNHEKKDIEWLPFNPNLTPLQVGTYLRSIATRYVRHVVLEAQSNRLPVLRQGSAGPEVGRVQDILGVRGPDIFGPITDASVRKFQREHGLIADGIVGRNTWAVLLMEEARRK